MSMSRRMFLGSTTMGLAGAAALRDLLAAEGPAPKIRISARHFSGNFENAKKAGMEGVEVGVGGPPKLSIADPKNREKIKEQMKATGVVVSSLSMDFLNGNPVATEPDGVAWLTQCIEAAKDLGAVGILVPFFGGKSSLKEGNGLKKDAVDALVGRLKEVAPKAKEAGVCLGLENTLSAKLNLEILDMVGADGVGVYYDIGNSTGGGYDVPAELRALKGRLAMIHFKDGGSYLGEGKVKMEPIGEAVKAIDYKGWIVLETSNPSKNAEADCRRNADFIRKLLGLTA